MTIHPVIPKLVILPTRKRSASHLAGLGGSPRVEAKALKLVPFVDVTEASNGSRKRVRECSVMQTVCAGRRQNVANRYLVQKRSGSLRINESPSSYGLYDAPLC